MLQENYLTLLSCYTDDATLKNSFWKEIEACYSQKGRHYHGLAHLEHLLTELTEIKDRIKNWNTVLFALYYHDMVYNTLRQDNEAKSAVVAEKRMRELGIPAPSILHCKEMILATKSHHQSADNDTNYFTDADLSVLGADWDIYWKYCQDIRKEYAIYPDFVYYPGRKKVLKHFLDMERIYKTDWFFSRFEQQAWKNLGREMKFTP